MKDILGGILLAAAVALFGYAIYNTAWISDDAYISYRTVDNLVNGYGLTWNTAERVQNFTNPLWVFLNAVPYAFVNDPDKMYFVGLGVSASVSLLAVIFLAFGAASGPAVAFFAIAALTFCRAYMDFATSGLENPMNHLLLALFMLGCARSRWSYPVLFAMSLCAGLSMVNRMDTALIYAPVLAYAWLSERNLRATLVLGAGLLPFIGWEIFSIIYYGFPFPNTAYAKLGTGINTWDMITQGCWYLANSCRNDPLTIVLLVAGLFGVPWLLRQGRYTALALGGILYLVYVVKIGGDFMQGRFLTPPLFVAVLLISRLPSGGRWPRWIAATVIAVLISASVPNIPILTGRSYAGPKDFKDAHGIADERKFHMLTSGLKFYTGPDNWPNHNWVRRARQLHAANRYDTDINGSVGFRGFFAGRKQYIIDYYSLSDPLLARLPARYNPEWRIGHFTREVPTWYSNYIAELAQDLQKRQGDGPALRVTELADEYAAPKLSLPPDTDGGERPATDISNDTNLKAFYDQIEVIIRGPLWSKDRWKAIWNMNLGRYDYLIDWNAYRFPMIRTVESKNLSKPRENGSRWDAKGNQTLTTRGLEIRFPEIEHNSLIEMSLDSDDSYALLYVKAGEVVTSQHLVPDGTRRRGLWVREVTVPNAAIRSGYDALRVFRYAGDKRASVGHITLK